MDKIKILAPIISFVRNQLLSAKNLSEIRYICQQFATSCSA